MTLSDWLSNVSPDTALGLLTVAGTLGGWAISKARGKQTQSFSSLIDDVLNNFLEELLDDYSSGDKTVEYLRHAREYIEARAWKVFAKRGIPKNALTIRLLHSGIERVTAELGNRIAQRTIPKQLELMTKRAEELAELFRKIPEPKGIE